MFYFAAQITQTIVVETTESDNSAMIGTIILGVIFSLLTLAVLSDIPTVSKHIGLNIDMCSYRKPNLKVPRLFPKKYKRTRTPLNSPHGQATALLPDTTAL